MAGISRATIADFEKGRRTAKEASTARLRAALEAEGVEFLADADGEGVRLRPAPTPTTATNKEDDP